MIQLMVEMFIVGLSMCASSSSYCTACVSSVLPLCDVQLTIFDYN